MPWNIKEKSYNQSEVNTRRADESSPSGVRTTSLAKFAYGDPAHDFDPSDPSARFFERQSRNSGHNNKIRDPYSSIRHFQGQNFSGTHYTPDEIRHAHHAPRSGANFCAELASSHSYHYVPNTKVLESPIRNFHHQQPAGDNHIRSPSQAGGHVQQTSQKDRTSSDHDDQEIMHNDSPSRDDSENGCTCKKSKCLKLYCMCFAVNAFCDDKCRCLECKNDPRFSSRRNEAVQAVLARNPLAFENKLNPTLDIKESTQLKNGCKCKKSMCLKKYCECFHAQVNCSLSCRCVGCKNMPPGMERPFPDDQSSIGSSLAVTVNNKFNVYDAAHNLSFLKNMSPSKEDTRQVSRMTSATHATDHDENNRVQTLQEKEEKCNSVSTPLCSLKQELLDDTLLAADLLLQAAVAMTKREPQITDLTHTPEKNMIRNSDFDMNHSKRQLIEPKVPAMDPKRSKFEKDCKSPNSTTATNTVSQLILSDEEGQNSFENNSCPRSGALNTSY